MSAVKEEDEEVMLCASCGTAGGNDIKLRNCTACYLVRYCGVKCQKDHRSKHKKECRKRAAELRDELLFKQPESSYRGDCPICCVPIPIGPQKSTLTTCCSKLICNGCDYANQKRERKARLQQKCAFCRDALAETKEEINERLMKRIESNDPVAMQFMGTERFYDGDYKAAFEYWTKAAALGDAHAHYRLSLMYGEGTGVEKDEKKYVHHLEQAAIGGHPEARHNLGCVEEGNGRLDRAAKHWIIAAKLGFDDSLECVKKLYQAENISKDVFAAALRGHKAAIEATESPQRKAATEFFDWYDRKYWREREI